MKNYEKMWDALEQYVEKEREGFTERVEQDFRDETAVRNMLIYQNIACVMDALNREETKRWQQYNIIGIF